MRIDNTNTQSSLNALNRAQQTTNHYGQQLATGRKNSNAANNAAAYAIISGMYSNLGATEQAQQNTQNSSAMLATAAGGTSEIVDNLSSLRATMINAANGTNNASDLRTLQKVADQTIASIDDTAASTTYNGMSLLSQGKSAVVAGVDSYDNVDIASMTSQSLGLTDEQGNSTLNLTSQSGIESSLDIVDKALNAALDQATTIGAQQQALGFRLDNEQIQASSLTASANSMDSTDMAEAMMNFSNSNTQQQLALYATKMNNHNREAVLSLLQ